jgi:thiamine biosynthesis protein ThiI
MRELLITGDEIALKGGNRRYFEGVLQRNIWNALGRTARIRPHRLFGRTAFPLPADMDDAMVLERVREVPGVARYALARRVENDQEAIEALALEVAREAGGKSFGVRCKRSFKAFPKTSLEIEREVGSHVVVNLGLKVNLTKPDFWLHVQITERGSYVTCQEGRGLGGLPVRACGRVVALLSGGIDSPVASYKMFLRGTQVIFCHFLNQGQDPLAVRTKIEDLVEILTRFQQKSVLYVIPFEHLQQALLAGVPSPYRMIAYRRVMMRIAGMVAQRENCEAIVTGDAVGQVASQTLANLQSIWSASDLPVLAPLIAAGKMDTVELAKKIGTFETSIEPYPDCCQFMISEHPATRSNVAELEEFEAKIENLAELEAQAFEQAEMEIRYFPEPTGDRYPNTWRGRRKRWNR